MRTSSVTGAERSEYDRLIPLIMGVVMFACIHKPLWADISFHVERFVIEGANPLDTRTSNAVLAPFTGEHTGIEKLRAAADALEKALTDRGYDFHRVTLPPQVLESGEVTLEIRHLVVGSVSTSGNRHFSDENLRRSLPQLKEGETPNTRALSRALAVANFNNAKRTRLTFGRGESPDTLDARIEARERSPQQWFTWINNTGTEETTRLRLGLGYQHHNLFDRDQLLTATYTTSPEDTEQVGQYGINYQVPLYNLTSTVSLFHVKSDIDTGRVANAFDVQGSGTTTGARYGQVLNRYGSLRQRAYLEVIDKLFDNDIDFEGTNIGADVRSRPLGAAWQIEWGQAGNNGLFNIGYNRNLGGGSFNDEISYAASRFGASPDWDAWRYTFNQDLNLPGNWLLAYRLRGQYADEPLISGEQLGLGGASGPRGFEEWEAGVDRGASMRFQFWAPPVTGGIQFGAFLDHAFGKRIQALPGEPEDLDLTSVGVSAKWQWNNHLVSALDIGHVLAGFDDIPQLTQEGDNQVHFSLIYRFQGD